MAKIKVLTFGMITDIIGSTEISLAHISDTDNLLITLKQTYPKLNDCKFMLSLDKKIISTNQPLNNHSEIAILPPFSGG